MKNIRINTAANKGFSLVELAVVLVILGFVIGALMLPLQAQRENTFRLQTENQLEIARKALIGFAQTHGRLPCPATNAGTGIFPDDSAISNPETGGACVQQWGFLPAATLGIQPTDEQGFAIDGWNNRIRYAVTQSSAVTVPVTPATPDFTSNIPDNPATPLVNEADGMNVVGLANLTPDLRVCRSGLPATGITATKCSALPETNYLINNAVAVIYSTGPTVVQGVGGEDENENLNAVGGVDTVFVSRGVSASNAPGGEFDHMVVWISPYVLYNAMIQAGQLH